VPAQRRPAEDHVEAPLEDVEDLEGEPAAGER